MTFRVNIEMDNSAFADNPGAELERILNEIKMNIHYVNVADGWKKLIKDENGNMVGYAMITKE